MITTDLNAALAALESLDPEALARELLTETGQAAVEHETKHPHPGGWKDQTGTLHDSYYFDVRGAVLEVGNTADYADELHVREGYSVLTTFDSGEIVEMLHEAFRKHDKDRVI